MPGSDCNEKSGVNVDVTTNKKSNTQEPPPIKGDLEGFQIPMNTRKLRARSGRSNNRDPNFVYNDGFVFDSTLRERSVSCSNLSQKVKRKMSNNRDLRSANAKVNNNSERCQDYNKKLQYGETWRKKQAQLSQQRIDVLLSNTIGKPKVLSEGATLYRSATEGDLSSINFLESGISPPVDHAS